MKKKNTFTKLSLDKETIARLNAEQLTSEQTREVEGGATAFTSGGNSCCGPDTYTSCAAK